MLIGLRICLGPLLIVLCVLGSYRALVVATLALAFLSDVFDGVIARRLGVATVRLRIADSWADGLFYVCVATAVWLTVPELVILFRIPLLIVILLQLSSYAFDLLKYRRISSLHAYSAKAWGITLFAAAVAILGFHTGAHWLRLTIVFGFISNIDGIAIKLILTHWQADVPSFMHALKLRQRSL